MTTNDPQQELTNKLSEWMTPPGATAADVAEAVHALIDARILARERLMRDHVAICVREARGSATEEVLDRIIRKLEKTEP